MFSLTRFVIYGLKRDEFHSIIFFSQIVHSCLTRSLPTAINIINQDDDRYVVLACLEVVEELFKVIKGDAFPEKKHVEEFHTALLNIFQGKVCVN